MSPEPTDQELLDAIARADDGEGAFAALYERHKTFAMRVGRRFAGDEAGAADAVQEAFLALMRKARRGMRLRGKLTTWLYPVVRNHAARARERRRLAPPVGDEPAAVADEGDDLASVRGAVDALDESAREVVMLRVVEGLSVAETAAALGIAEGTVKSRLHAAVRTLRADPRLRAYFDAG